MKKIISLITYYFLFLIRSPHLLVFTVAFVFTKDMLWLFCFFIWILIDKIHDKIVINKGAISNMIAVVEIFNQTNDDECELKEVFFDDFLGMKVYANETIHYLANLESAGKFKNVAKKIIETNPIAKKRIRFIEIIEKQLPYKFHSLSSFPVYGSESFVFLNRNYDMKNTYDQFLLLHEVSHCSMNFGQVEWVYKGLVQKALVICFLLFVSLMFSNIYLYIALGVIVLLHLNATVTRQEKSQELVVELIVNIMAILSFPAEKRKEVYDKIVTKFNQRLNFLKRKGISEQVEEAENSLKALEMVKKYFKLNTLPSEARHLASYLPPSRNLIAISLLILGAFFFDMVVFQKSLSITIWSLLVFIGLLVAYRRSTINFVKADIQFGEIVKSVLPPTMRSRQCS